MKTQHSNFLSTGKPRIKYLRGEKALVQKITDLEVESEWYEECYANIATL